MLKVGLTGGYATGKSHVGETLVSLGCHLIQADELGHQVLLPGGAAYDAVVREFGGGILESNGEIDRRRLAAEVFGEPERLERLSRLVHPPVIEMEERQAAEIAAKDPHAIVIVEAAILIETGSHRRFDKLILVVCDERQQIERAMRRDNLSEQAVRDRLARQMPLSEKRKYADYIVDTSGSREDTFEQTRRVYESLRPLARDRPRSPSPS